MPPRGRGRGGSKLNINGNAKTPVKKPRAGKAHKIPPPLPNGEVLTDVKKKPWRVGEGIGCGGFGLIYLASDDTGRCVGPDAEYVMKVEPISNGPLFCELHFYQRAAKAEMIDEYVRSRKLKYLGIPKYITTGQHTHNGVDYRFLVMPRFGTDLHKLFVSSNKKFPKNTVLCLGLRLLDALEYMHTKEYVHADIKASNILLGCAGGAVNPNEMYLVDFGLAFRFDIDGKHKEYKEDPRRVHDGTIEFTSRDAHKGVVPSRRGDLEILGYCLLQWLCGQLPWEDNLDNKEYVRDEKIKYMSNVDLLFKTCFPGGGEPAELKEYLKYVSKLTYDQKPDYNKLRKIFQSSLPKQGKKVCEWTLDFGTAPTTQEIPQEKKPKKRKSSENQASGRIKVSKQSLEVQEKLTPAMRERLAKLKTAPSTEPLSNSLAERSSNRSVHASSSRASASRRRPPPREREDSPESESDDPPQASPAKVTGKRRVKRSKAPKTDMAVQTSPVKRKRKR